MLFGLVVWEGFRRYEYRDTINRCVGLEGLVLCVKYIPMILPAVDEPITSELAHRRCAELCKNRKYYNFI